MTADAATQEHYRRLEHARQMAMTTSVLAVEAAMTEEERERFLSLTAAPGTGLHGAHVADVLDIYVDHDAHLEWTEPFYEDEPTLAALYEAVGYDPEESHDDPERAYGHYLRSMVASRAVLARAVLARAVPDIESVKALAVAALAIRAEVDAPD